MFPIGVLLQLFAIQNVPAQSAAPPDEIAILQRIRTNVRAQLVKSANYTCVQTVERAYYAEKHTCSPTEAHGKPKEFMRDRLRLDVAVSEGKEIFSWHGENRFTSGGISSVIGNGPRTSGQFVGFLRNIFLTSGVQFRFTGASQLAGKPVYTFDYLVPLARSTYFLQGRDSGSVIPFHGTFSADSSNFELVHMSIIADQVPRASGICSAETDIDYQLVNISGQQSLMPSAFVLEMEGDGELYTVNRNQYLQCREFRGESTLHFTTVETVASAVAHHVIDEPLPAGLTFKASLEQPIDDKTAYIGDAVEARLVDSLPVPGTSTTIPKGATLHGVISSMERHSGYEPSYWLVGVKFERLNAGQDSYLLNAWPAAGTNGLGSNLRSAFHSDRVLSEETAQAARRGLWFEDGSHFRIPRNYTRYWRTEKLKKNDAEPSSQ